MTPDEHTISEQMLPVGDGHKLYIQDWGNSAASRTFLYLHGGPGSGCSDANKLFFDGSRDRVIFFDQRGAGKSTPGGALKANTTSHLVQDIRLILAKLGCRQVTIVGGSWGSTLALAYALDYPESVEAMVLRGIFTGSRQEIDYLDKGLFKAFFPDVWEAYLARTPVVNRHDPTAYHAPRTLGSNAKASKDGAYACSELESSVAALDDRHNAADFATFNPDGMRIELHYTQHGCFMPDRHILKNAHKLTMPIWLVQGRYDMVCPPVTAYEINQLLPQSELIFTTAGHSGMDRNNFEAVRATISALARQ